MSDDWRTEGFRGIAPESSWRQSVSVRRWFIAFRDAEHSGSDVWIDMGEIVAIRTSIARPDRDSTVYLASGRTFAVEGKPDVVMEEIQNALKEPKPTEK